MLGAGAALTGVALDAAVRAPALRGFSFKDGRTYAVTALASVVLWTSVAVLVAAARSRRVAAAVGLALGTVLLVPGALLLTYGRVPTDGEARFFASEWLFYLKSAATPGNGSALWMVLLPGVLLAGFYRLALRLRPALRDAYAAAVLLCATGVGITTTGTSRRAAFTADMSGVRFAGEIVSWMGRPPPFFKLAERRQRELPAREQAHHVLWVVHETVGARYLRTPAGAAVTPHLLKLKEDPAVVWLDRLHAVSS